MFYVTTPDNSEAIASRFQDAVALTDKLNSPVIRQENALCASEWHFMGAGQWRNNLTGVTRLEAE